MAMTFTESFMSNLGDKLLIVGYVTHDGAETSCQMPVGTVDSVILLDAGTAAAGATVTTSGHDVVFSAAAGSGRTSYILFIGA